LRFGSHNGTTYARHHYRIAIIDGRRNGRSSDVAIINNISIVDSTGSNNGENVFV
jgi:hypothetical protein